MVSALRTAKLFRAIVMVAIASLGLASCESESATEPAADTIGPAGGTLTLASGNVTLVFPPGAVSREIAVTASSTSEFPATSRLVGGSVYDLGPAETRFAIPVQITITFSLSSLPPGVRERELRLHTVAESAWQGVTGSSGDTTRHSVTAAIDGFGVFGVLGVPIASVVVTPQDPTIQVGETLELTATARDAAGNQLPDRTITWSASGGGVVEVDQDGTVTGLTTGQALVTATGEERQGGTTVTVVPAAGPTLQLVAAGLASPVHLTAPAADVARLFVVEKAGVIRIIRDNSVLAVPFLDIRDLVSSPGERGLLSMAFHPDYASNGEFFVNYTDLNGDTRVVRYRASGDPDVADPGSAELIIAIEQPYSNHNGGQLAFGPDGMLYIGMGDGGSGGDPDGNGQNLGTLLGAMLRIDVDGGTPYGIPTDNPFINDAAARDEIWAYGLRNPWRFSFDRQAGDLYIADVGQSAWEEVDVQPAASDGGENYGWNIMEGAHCFNAATCDQTGLTLPVQEYSHGDGCSITGGFVYRGSRLPQLAGHYFYADFCATWVRSFRYDGGQAVDQRDWSNALMPGSGISSFGEDSEGELYIMTLGGNLYRIVPALP